MAELIRTGQDTGLPGTRERIVEAALDLLVESGYSGFSTRLVASRAGVSQGALQHHFHSKSDLCVSAMSCLLERISGEFVEAIPSIADPLSRFDAVVVRLFAVFRGPTFIAGLELRLAARTDPDLRKALLRLDTELDEKLQEGASAMFPEMAGLPGFDDLIETTLASLRGLALANLDQNRDPAPALHSIRRELGRGAAGILEGRV